MSRYLVTSRCECQAELVAELDEQRHMISGFSVQGGTREIAPAHRMNVNRERFDIGWLCNVCGRNTLRSFYADALREIS